MQKILPMANKGGTMQAGPNSFLAVKLYLMDMTSLDEWADLVEQAQIYILLFRAPVGCR